MEIGHCTTGRNAMGNDGIPGTRSRCTTRLPCRQRQPTARLDRRSDGTQPSAGSDTDPPCAAQLYGETAIKMKNEGITAKKQKTGRDNTTYWVRKSPDAQNLVGFYAMTMIIYLARKNPEGDNLRALINRVRFSGRARKPHKGSLHEQFYHTHRRKSTPKFTKSRFFHSCTADYW